MVILLILSMSPLNNFIVLVMLGIADIIVNDKSTGIDCSINTELVMLGIIDSMLALFSGLFTDNNAALVALGMIELTEAPCAEAPLNRFTLLIMDGITEDIDTLLAGA